MEIMKRLKKYFNVPIIIYFIIFLVCGAMILPNAIDSSIAFSALFANIGYSLLASNIAGILFDLGNNMSTCRKSQRQYDAITFSHSNLLNDIIAVVDDLIYNKIFRQMFILYPDQKSLFDDETMRK